MTQLSSVEMTLGQLGSCGHPVFNKHAALRCRDQNPGGIINAMAFTAPGSTTGSEQEVQNLLGLVSVRPQTQTGSDSTKYTCWLAKAFLIRCERQKPMRWTIPPRWVQIHNSNAAMNYFFLFDIYLHGENKQSQLQITVYWWIFSFYFCLPLKGTIIN